jgi:hypothetical protein
MTLRPGTRLKSKVDGAEFILVTDGSDNLECAGEPLEVVFTPPSSSDDESHQPTS